VRYTPEARREFARRLARDWRDLADQLDIPTHQISAFSRGFEAQEILDWLAARKRVDQLPAALDDIGRSDLAGLLRSGVQGDDGDLAAESANASRPRSRARPLVVAGGVVAATATALTLVLLLVWPTDGQPRPDPSTTQSGAPQPSGSPSTEVFEARIEQTMDVDTNRFVGVISYRDPTESGRGTDAGHYPEGGTVHVVCVLRYGREIRDKEWRDRPLSTRVWYRLSTPDPQWVPDMYVRLVPSTGKTALPVPPSCGGQHGIAMFLHPSSGSDVSLCPIIDGFAPALTGGANYYLIARYLDSHTSHFWLASRVTIVGQSWKAAGKIHLGDSSDTNKGRWQLYLVLADKNLTDKYDRRFAQAEGGNKRAQDLGDSLPLNVVKATIRVNRTSSTCT
jgi:hypothetical protein